MSKVFQIFQEQARITNALPKQALDLVVDVMFLVTVSRRNVTLERAPDIFDPNSRF